MISGPYISLLGLGLDILGAVLLAWGLITKSSAKVREEASSAYGWNYAFVRSAVEAKRDAQAGAVLLVVGFLCQAEPSLMALYRADHALLWVVLLLLISGLAVFGFLLFWWKIHWFGLEESLAKTMAPLLSSSDSFRQQPNTAALNMYGRMMNCERKEGESDAEYWNRVRTKINISAPSPTG